MQLGGLRCPYCQKQNLRVHARYMTRSNGERSMIECRECKEVFSETKLTVMHGLRTPVGTIAQVLRARFGGMSFNETCHAYEISEDALRLWEERFADLKQPLLIYTLAHRFLEQVIEDDEL